MYPLNLDYTCGICRNKRLPYSELYVYGPYAGKLRDLLIALKFRNQFWVSQVISDLLIKDERFANFISGADLLLPVPLHSRRLDSRGFNQVYLFTKEFKKRLSLSIPISKWDVLRVKETEFQKSLSLRRRILNLRKAFMINNISAIQGKKIILIDDILTTGATVMSVSKLLRKSGAKEIKVVIIAR
ncbi:ComF family protein [Candidatus Dependentiae bacterium]|nr:ComF family protein [Candidatus Dependentiae bacterium]